MKQLLIWVFVFLSLCLLVIARPEQNYDVGNNLLFFFEICFEENVDLEREKAVEFLKRTIFHPGKTKCEEQKREASEKYEERCEPSVNKLTGSRYCKLR